MATRKTFLLSILFSLVIKIVCGQEGSTLKMSNGAITIANNCWLVDPDSLRGNYPVGEQTMVITSSVSSKLGIHIDSAFLRLGDLIDVYDGPTTSSPLLTSITRSNWLDAGFKSSGPVITVYFRGGYPDQVPASWGWRLRIRCIEDINQTVDFLPIFQSPNQGNIRLDDYDRDGDQDALIGGVVYRNDSHDDSLYVFDRILKPIGNWRNANMIAADFDNDGSKDIFITGETDATGIYAPTAKIFKNVNGVFNAVSGTTFLPATKGAVSVLDFNADGKTDIAYSGYLGGSYVFVLYLNNGNFNFTPKTFPELPGLIEASMSWYDYDNDGDLDLLYNGFQQTTQPLTGLFINNGNTSFTHADLIMYATYSGDIRWVDVNMDGKFDIVNTGFNYPAGGIAPEILFNNGNNTFTRVITNLPPRSSTHFDWADYDGDGDMDIVFTGSQSTPTNILQDPGIYKNNGNGNFTRVDKISLGPIQSLSTPRWIDFNKDSKWDVFIPARDFYPSLLYKNMGVDSFQVSSYPFTAYQIQGTALAEDFTNDGVPDILFAGELNDQDCNEGNSSVLIKSLGWRVFPTAILTPVTDLKKFFNFSTGWRFAYWRWGDVDSDGKDDILASNDTYGPSTDSLRIFKNNGNSNFSLLYTGFPIPTHYNNQVGVVDIDNDGVNELYLAPNKLCRWNGNGFTILNNELNYCGPNGCNNIYYDFADFNNDGLMDVAYSASGQVQILRNNGHGKFENITGGWSIADNVKYLKWADFDNDGDPDLLTDKGILENTSYGGFRNRDVDIPQHGHTGVADINNDGWLDIFALQYRTEIGPAKLYYNQQAKLFFQDKTPPGFIQINNGVSNEGAEAFDVDNDGDNDLIYATNSGCSYSGIFLNNYNIRRPNISVRSPNGRENFLIGTTQIIKWLGNQLSGSVKIELSLDSGITWTSLTTNAPSSNYGGQFEWSINGVAASTKCLVKITDNGTNNLIDKSDRTFTISVPTGINNPQIIQYVKIYPNPASEKIFLEIKSELIGKKILMNIFDEYGRLVEVKTVVGQRGATEIDLHRLLRGIYFLRLSTVKAFETHRIVKL